VPVLGVLPHLRGLDLPEEDSLGLDGADLTLDGVVTVDIAVARLPHIANFDDFDPLRAEPGVRVRYVECSSDLGEPHLAIIPGTKTTMADLAWLKESGLAAGFQALAAKGVPIIGICGGYQMLGRRIDDPTGSESRVPTMDGLGLLSVDTLFEPVKRTVRVEGRLLATAGPLAAAAESPITGYEIHMGTTLVDASAGRLVRIDRRSSEAIQELDGAVSADGLGMGTYLHGLFDNDILRHALLDWLAARRDSRPRTANITVRRQIIGERDRQLDRLADVVRSNLDLAPLLAACGLA